MVAAVESMVYKGETPWHGLGTQIDENVDLWSAFSQAGLDWEVETRPVFSAEGAPLPAQEVCRWEGEGDEKAPVTLGVVGPRWTPLQNREAFAVFEPLIDSGELSLHTAGSLFGGRRVWALCQSNMRADVAPNDEVRNYALLSNSHDGTLAVHLGWTPIRVVCANTEALARRDGRSSLIKVRHSTNVVANVNALRAVMDAANESWSLTVEQYLDLRRRAISPADLRKYLKRCLRITLSDADLPTRSKNTLNRIEGYFETGPGNAAPGVAGTWWAAYNAMTEYYSHHRGRSSETRLDRAWFGAGRADNTEALELALELSA